jgi:hypothetical protein
MAHVPETECLSLLAGAELANELAHHAPLLVLAECSGQHPDDVGRAIFPAEPVVVAVGAAIALDLGLERNVLLQRVLKARRLPRRRSALLLPLNLEDRTALDDRLWTRPCEALRPGESGAPPLHLVEARHEFLETGDHRLVEWRHDLPLLEYLHERLAAADDLGTMTEGNNGATNANPAIEVAPLPFNFLDRGRA